MVRYFVGATPIAKENTSHAAVLPNVANQILLITWKGKPTVLYVSKRIT